VSDQLISRLRSANPTLPAHVSNDQLRERILASTPTWALTAPTESSRASTRRVRRWVASGAVAAAALAGVLTISLSGRAPSVAQAFPALNGPSTLTPAALQQSLRYYGVSGDGGINITKGRTVDTPWGTGYILTGPDNRFVCVVAPGLSSADWGASCAQTAMAASSGTAWGEYAYDSGTDTARLIALFPQGATATMQTRGGAPRHLSLSNGLLAVDITSPAQIAVRINGHTVTHQFSPQQATPAPTSAPGSSGSTTAAAATVSPITKTAVTAQYADGGLGPRAVGGRRGFCVSVRTGAWRSNVARVAPLASICRRAVVRA
jgi:hypothetical protein